MNMDIPTTLNEIATLSIDARIRLVQAIWDGIEADAPAETLHDRSYPDLAEPQQREIDRRIDEHERKPDNTLTWDEVKVSIQERFKSA